MIAPIKKFKKERLNFPTIWQAVLFRNYGYVSVDKIAKTLNCPVDNIIKEAIRLGLNEVKYNFDYEKKGYLTIIRNNWFLLDYDQLCTLLGYDREKLENILKNEDFFWVKLGFFKPYCDKVTYFPLTEEQLKKTEEIRQIVNKYINGKSCKPFDFFAEEKEDKYEFKNIKGRRIVHGYLSPCGDVFMEDSQIYLSNKLLLKYKNQGVNGIWIHGVLSQLSYYPFDSVISNGYETRRKNLSALVKRCKEYGIKIYLYLNEPRALAKEKFKDFPHLMGRSEGEMAGFCFEQKEVQAALYNAIKDLFSAIKGLGGIISITMSENLTHCNYRPDTNCPVCKNIEPYESASKVNNVMMQALRDSGSDAELIANLWGWTSHSGWTFEQTRKGVELLDKDISVLCVSEQDKEIEKGGIKGRVREYSLSNPGPSKFTEDILLYAKKLGHKTYAKIQINNSWEMAAVPYLPVYDILLEHLENLNKIGVNDLMMTWTLGGYPSPMMNLVASYEKDPEKFDIDIWYKDIYGEDSEIVHEAVRDFCLGFKEYPFSMNGLYYSPKTLGASNLWDMEPMEKESSMVSYSFDDYERWTDIYPINVYIGQFSNLLYYWHRGLNIIERINNRLVNEMRIFIKVAFNHIYNDLLQTKFSYYKRNKKKYINEIKILIEEAKESAEEMISLMRTDGTIGYEASNHYFYTDRNLIEKIIQMIELKTEI